MEKEKSKTAKKNFFQRLNAKRKKLMLVAGTFIMTNLMSAMSAYAAAGGNGGTGGNGGAGGAGGLNTTTGKTQFDDLIEFFATWIGRIGGVIALVGAVMFGFAQKSDDPEGKQRGVNTMVSGVIVFAISQAADFFTNMG